MAKPPSQPRPTDAELEILNVLWQHGPSTVRDVYEQLAKSKPVVYTTVLKLLQIMSEKDLVRRDETERAHVYEPRLPQEQMQKQLVTDLLNRAFEGSAKDLVMQALSSKRASREDLAEIRLLLDSYERGAK